MKPSKRFMMFKYHNNIEISKFKNQWWTENQIEAYIDDLNYAAEFHIQFQDNQDTISKNRYFKSDNEFKAFIEFWNINMVPISATWWSNKNGSAIRWRVIDLIHNKNNCNEATDILEASTSLKQNYMENMNEIKINTLEQLKFLESVSKNIEKCYFKVRFRF